MRRVLIGLLMGLASSAFAGKVFVPSHYLAENSYPLYVLLHGCLQSSADFAKATRFNALAEEKGFITLFPEQSRARNGALCWNWFESASQRRGGEAKLIIDEIEQVMSRYSIDRKKIYVIGFSAGGGLASILAHCYTEYFAGAVIHSGLTYKAAQSSMEAFTAMRSGSQMPIPQATLKGYECGGRRFQTSVPVMMIHGEKDGIVTAKYSSQGLEQYTLLNDYLDDGENNQSFRLGEVEEKSGTVEGGHSYTLQYWKHPNSPLARLSVRNMDHAWSGGPQQSYSDPKGPDASRMIWRFFNGEFHLELE